MWMSRFRLSAKLRQSSIVIGSIDFIVVYLIDVISLSIRNRQDVDAE